MIASFLNCPETSLTGPSLSPVTELPTDVIINSMFPDFHFRLVGEKNLIFTLQVNSLKFRDFSLTLSPVSCPQSSSASCPVGGASVSLSRGLCGHRHNPLPGFPSALLLGPATSPGDTAQGTLSQ